MLRKPALILQIWDEELAYMAQFWAGNCEFELNENRHTQSSTYSYVGQTLAAGSSYVKNYTVMIRRWFDIGRINYNYYSRSCIDEDGNEADGEEEDGGPCAPYTQVCDREGVWGENLAYSYFHERNTACMMILQAIAL